MIDLQLWKERKKELKLSLQDIANETGISISTLKDIFRGATAAPRIDTVWGIEMVLGLKQCFSPPANALMRWRIKSGLTRAQMAQKLGVSIYSYLSMECGYLAIQEEHIKIICETFNVSEEEILGRTVEDAKKAASNAIKEEITRTVGFIDFILSNADTWDRHAYYDKLPDGEKELFVYYLLFTKEDLQEEKEMLLSVDITNAHLMDAYQSRPHLWKTKKTNDEQ